ELGRELLRLIGEELDATAKQLDAIQPPIFELCPQYDEAIAELANAVQMMRGELNRGYAKFADAVKVFVKNKPRLPGGRNQDENEKERREAAKDMLDSVREPFFKSIVFLAHRFS